MMAMTSSSVHLSSKADVTTMIGAVPVPLSRRAKVKALACGFDCTYNSGVASRSNILEHSCTASYSSGSCESDTLMLDPSRSRRTPCSTTARDRRMARSPMPLSGAARTKAVRSLSSGWRNSEASMPVRDTRRLLAVAENANDTGGRRTRTAAAKKKPTRTRAQNAMIFRCILLPCGVRPPRHEDVTSAQNALFFPCISSMYVRVRVMCCCRSRRLSVALP
mmetsp:Transcript_1398/g.3054  ORF Transcript_1398/g.3054 Transcript_1398/m.3054 type:complete len:221 (+) Transcript_1398:587-1249(+)